MSKVVEGFTLYMLNCFNTAFNVGFRPAALDRWTDEYLIGRMKDSPLSVAITPNG